MKGKLRKAWSILLAFAMVLTSIALPGVSEKASAAENSTFTLYFYYETENTLYLDIWNHAAIEFTADVETEDVFGWANPQGKLQPVADNANWYSIDISVTDASASDGFDIYNGGSEDKVASYDSQWNNAEDYAVLAGGSKTAYAVKDGKLYTNLSDAGLTIGGSENPPEPTVSLDTLKAVVDSVPADYTTLGFKEDSVKAVADALAAANTLIEDESTDGAKIEEASRALTEAIDGLVFSSELFIKKVSNYNTDAIRGMDVSSYLSIMKTFEKIRENKKAAGASDAEIAKIGFKDWDGKVLDEQGFFNLLAECGVNYIRIRVWNDPYDKDGNGYGGGNNDIDAAVEMGKYVTKAGMKVLIDFHLSDFWADPGKQQAPKAWKDYTLDQKADAVSDYITSSLKKLVTDNQVNVTMVQVGNETNGAVCGVKNWPDINKIFAAGCDAVHAFDKNILAAIHFTNPQQEGLLMNYAKNLADYDGDGDGQKEGVDYDVLASSFYPNSHGTMENLTSVLTNIATTYDKYVMVAETSWANCMLIGDDIADCTFKVGDYVDYNVSLQGQTNELRDVVDAVNKIDVTLSNGEKAALGFFYWEPAWIPVQSVYDANGKLKEDAEDIAKENRELWNEFGSGWASVYASEYDPDDAGLWWGGSGMTHQAVFDFDGNPLSVLDVYNPNYLKYGAEAPEVKPDGYSVPEVSIEVGQKVDDLLPKAKVTYNDSTKVDKEVNWKKEDVDKVNEAAATTAGIGTHTITGTLSDDDSFEVKVTVVVNGKNLLSDPGFENEESGWTVEYEGETGEGKSPIVINGEDPRSGSKGLHFWSDSNFKFTASTTVDVTEAGYYNAFVYMQGLSSAGTREGESLKLTVKTADGTQYSSEDVTLTGWINWQQVKVNDIYVSEDMIKSGKNTITLSVEAVLNEGAWGTIDDASLYWNTDQITPPPSDTASPNPSSSPTPAVPTESAPATAVPTESAQATAAPTESAPATAAPTESAPATAAPTESAQATAVPTASAPASVVPTASAPASNAGVLAAQTITVKSSYTKTYGDKAFNLNAKAEGALSYTSNKKAVVTVDSTGKVTIKGAGVAVITVKAAATARYQEATKKVTITVKPKKVTGVKVKAASKKVTVQWKKAAEAAGYEIQYSTAKKFKKAKKVSAKGKSKAIKKLKSKKTYYIRVRAYAKNGSKKVYGAYSKTVKVKVK